MKETTSNYLWISLVMIIACVIVFLITPHVSATVLVYGSNPNYSAVVLPNGSYVHQGENISQGYLYDLSGVGGWSGVFAYWKNTDNIGYLAPTTIVAPDNLMRVYIDPATFPAGEWYQWDGSYCTDRYKCSSGFGRGNAYAFAVVKQRKATPTATPTPSTINSSIIIQSENGTVEVPVTLNNPQDTPVETQKPKNVTTIIIPTTTVPQTTIVVTMIPVVTPKSSPSMIVPIVSVFILGVLIRRRN